MADWLSVPRMFSGAKDRVVLGWTEWTALSVTGASWTAAAPPPQYCVDPAGFVHLRGAVTTAITPNINVVFTLPSGARPAVASRWALSSIVPGTVYLLIAADGQVTMTVGAATTVDLSPVAFSRG